MIGFFCNFVGYFIPMKTFDNEKYGFWGSIWLVFIVAWVLLAEGYGEVMRKTELLNLFLPGATYWHACMERPGGLIEWMATFLTQFFYHPWLGAAIFAAMLAAVQWMVAKATRLPGPYRPASAVVPAMLLLGYVELGYLIFSIKSPGIAFSPVLGVAFAVAMYWGYASLSIGWLKAVAMIACAMFYPLLGAYALFAALMCVANAAWRCFGKNRRQSLALAIGIALTIAAMVWWPWWWLRHAESSIGAEITYFAALPRLHADEWGMWIPYAIIAIFLLAATVPMHPKPRIKTYYASAALGIAALVSVAIFRCDDPNFHATVALENALDDGDFQRAAKIAKDIDFEPTRLNVMLSEIALNRTGEAPDWMFALENGSAPYNTPRSHRALHDAGAYVVSFNVGRVNYAYRWAMEYLVEFGPKVDYLKYMVRCALVNGERELAKKNLDVLSQTMHHRAWARKYRALLDDEKALGQDAQLAPVAALAQFKNYINMDYGAFERYLRPTLAAMDGGSWAMLDLSLQNCLANKEVSQFMTRIPYYASKQPRLPRHYQEAVVLADRIKHADVSAQYQIDPAVRASFHQFEKLNLEYQNLPIEQQRQRMKAIFGDTYWYYFVYVTDISQI